MPAVSPMVSVLMPAYNCEQFIAQAVSAILNQEYSDFEFIIINDGSTDKTRDIVSSFHDKRIIFIENDVNLGIVKTLNRGLGIARGKYIVRTDADDKALACLVGDLIGFLEANPDYILCGANMQQLAGNKIFRYPSNNEELKIYTLNACPFSHSTVAIRKSVLAENKLLYNEQVRDGEDHALWSELLPYGKFHNLNKVTLLYRESPGQITSNKEYASNYTAARKKIFIRHSYIFFELTTRMEMDAYATLVVGGDVKDMSDLERIGKLCRQLIDSNNRKHLFDDKRFKQFLFIKWFWLCLGSYKLGKKVFTVYNKYQVRSGWISQTKAKLSQFMQMIKS